jgi:hypothetical protein
MSTKNMYKVGMLFTNSTGLSLVAIEKETDKCVWVNGRRENKRSDLAAYFDEFEDARQFILRRAGRILDRTARDYEQAQSEQNKFENMTADKVRDRTGDNLA